MVSSPIQQAAALLKQGEVVVIPTETVYGLAADACNNQAVSRIYEIKGRPRFNPLIIHVSSIEMAQSYAIFSPLALLLTEQFWIQEKRSLTLVLPKKGGHLSSLVTAGLETVAVRLPQHSIALEIIKACGFPLAAPSANLSEQVSPTSSLAVGQSLKDKTPFLVEGGDCKIGLESTILDVSRDVPLLLRPGECTKEELEKLLKTTIFLPSSYDPVRAPGMMKRHYAPDLPMRLNVLEPHPKEFFITFGPPSCEHPYTRSLSISGDLCEAAANLFAILNETSQFQEICTGIAVMPIPNESIGMAINDRLKRASMFGG